MKMNKNTIKVIFSLCLALCCLFFSCKDPEENILYIASQPELYTSRFIVSHKSGLYPSSFFLSLYAPEGSKIYYSIDGSIPTASKAGNGRVFRYTNPIPVKNRNNEPNLLATNANTTQFYGVSNDPRGHMQLPYYPSPTQVPKATVIRAIEVGSNGRQIGDVVTRTYFIGNNLSEYGSHPVISLVTDPYNLLDVNYGIYVRGAAHNRWDGPNQYNFRLNGRDRERETFFELFDSSRRVAVSQGSGIRIRGGWSRSHGQKSFNVYFRSEYGTSDLNYRLLPDAVNEDGTPTTRYRDFILRNGGNDVQETKLRDVFIQSLLKDRAFHTQGGIPSIVYLNGEYWGVYNIQERYSDRYIEYKGYANSRDNVIMFQTWEMDEGTEADWNTLQPQIEALANLDMTIPANYNTFLSMFDLQSYIDYFAAQIYIHNQDWPQNNFRIWRVRSIEPGNPYGDGKWRFMMYDTEFSMGIYAGGSISAEGQNTFKRITEHYHHNARIFTKLMQNTDFAKQFVTTMMDLYNVNFNYSSNVAELDRLAAIYRPIMQAQNARWGGWNFDSNIQNMKTYLNNIRSAMTNNYLPAHFGSLGINASNLVNVTLASSRPDSIKINTTTPRFNGSWTGRYYSALPVTVTAIIPDGYNFDGWTVSGGTPVSPASLTTVVNFSGNVTITANYSLK